MTANESKFYLGYLRMLLAECNNTSNRSTSKKPIDDDPYALTEEIETNPKAPKFKVGD